MIREGRELSAFSVATGIDRDAVVIVLDATDNPASSWVLSAYTVTKPGHCLGGHGLILVILKDEPNIAVSLPGYV